MTKPERELITLFSRLVWCRVAAIDVTAGQYRTYKPLQEARARIDSKYSVPGEYNGVPIKVISRGPNEWD
ncbi:MAG: hypothetical protein ACRERU_02575 [Methylococcales bacterium]